jgi:hypothetical protein
MGTRRLDRFAAVFVVLLLGIVAARGTGTSAAFLVSTTNSGNNFTAIPDWKPPVISRATAIKNEGGIPGYVRAGGTYRVVASVVDDPSSNPPAGIASVQTNVVNLTTGGTAVAMPTAATTVGGLTYTHQSALQTVIAGKAAATYANSVAASDAVTSANVSAAFPFNAVVDNTVPTRTSVTISNGGIAGRITANDTITYAWNEIVDPNSVIAGWTGAAPTQVTVQVNNLNSGAGGDTVTIRNAANTAQLPLGSIALETRDYVTALTTFGGPANATRSTIAWNGGTSFTVTFGPADTPANVNNAGTNTANFNWTPQNGVYDRAGNLSTITVYPEPGGADREF